METITLFSNPLAQVALVFILIFTIVFAILQKTKLLGDGKKQTDSLVALAIALLVISVGYAMDIITKMVPFLAVGLVIILCFLLLFGIFGKKEIDFSSNVMNFFGVLAFLAVLIAAMYFTDSFSKIQNFFSGNSGWFANGLIILVVVAAFWFAYNGGSGGKSE